MKVSELNGQEIIESSHYYHILDRYARTWSNKQGEVIEKRNKAWFTGHGELKVHFLFESEKKRLWFNEDTGEYVQLDGIIIKDSITLNRELVMHSEIGDGYLAYTVRNLYEDFFWQVMDTMFLNQEEK